MVDHRPRRPGTATDTEAGPSGLLHIGDVQALQRAETVTMHTSSTQSWIDAGLTSSAAGEPRIYTAKEQQLFPDADTLDRRRRIPVEGHIAGFDEHRRWHDRHLPGAGLTRLESARLNEVWRSITAFLRAGDVLRLQWHADNTTDQLVDRAVHRDEVSIGVCRGRRRWTFLLDVQIRPGPARMITPAPVGSASDPTSPVHGEEERR